MIRRLLAISCITFAFPAAAQAVPAENYTDMWYNAAESGWGLSFTQHREDNQVFAVRYTYDARTPDPAGQFKPLWIVMPGGTWTSPASITGPVVVTNGRPFDLAGSDTKVTVVGTFTISFSSSGTGTFTYDIHAPPGLAGTDPAFDLPPMSGTRSIARQAF